MGSNDESIKKVIEEAYSEVYKSIADLDKEKDDGNSYYWLGRLHEAEERIKIKMHGSGDYHAVNGHPMSYKQRYETLKAFEKSGSLDKVISQCISLMESENHVDK